ncbi:lysine decarboxylase transcriptional regulator, CadC [Paraglaciecola sp. T6c]|uniref:winged helix-turn-helix domain-containing protein n=1 Tax=Pseudoalteromonas atlantica (strain T6c / ATCC BAA-1087) TaxID=3042615 RepID=UPI00005C75DB|nr:transcriptional regulator [Paraglaciecola sp. T6c]ABG42269.1 lysine decarboxylase transcriptional regulator, CadC [Paraglaciecola sp. T6c]
MTEQYWIGDFFVNLPRNQITHNEHTQTLPPKALAVLTYLAKHQGDVVSQEDLLNQVWKDTVVSPNSLQRCIAQLRKAFGDDGKAQGLIKTHAKKGYSLEAAIRWEDHQKRNVGDSVTLDKSPPNQHAKLGTNKVVKAGFSAKHIFVLSLFTVLVFALVISITSTLWPSSVHNPSPASPLLIDDIRLLTSTDNRELASAYSPDGKFIVFQRFPEVMCTSHLWAKNIETQQEFQLTRDLGSYGNLAFSEDGTSLIFVKQNNCSAPALQKKCFLLQQLDFEQALLSPQTPTTLMECKHTDIKSPTWLSANDIALLQKEQGRWKLIRYSVKADKSALLYEVNNGSVVSYDFSKKYNVIALTSVHESGKLYIEKLTPEGALLSSNPINFRGEIPQYGTIYPNFSPIEGRLIFSTGKQLFTVSFDGDISAISMPLTDAIGTPLFHPNGKKMLAIKGHYDSDIVSVPLSQFSYSRMQQTDTLGATVEYETVVRSMQEEDRAKYQPNGNLIAYYSEGDGTSQVWTSNLAQGSTASRQEGLASTASYNDFPHNGAHNAADNDYTKQRSQFPANTYVRNILWDADGQSLLVNASSQLTRLYLNGAEESISLSYPVKSLFHWDSVNKTIIANILYRGVSTLVELNLSNSDFSILTNHEVTWATKTDRGELIYKDNADRFWLSGAIENTLIPELATQGSHQHFIVKNDVIYGINDQYQLWKYMLETASFEVLGQLPDTVDYITDINDNAILITLRVAARKDVVELSIE